MISDVNQQWHNCGLCRLAGTRKNMVLGRGSATPYVVFLGEAPGRTEDAMGQPWVGTSGRFLEYALGEALSSPQGSTTFDLEVHAAYYLNVVACRPCDGRRGPNRQAHPEEIAACATRLKAQLAELRPEVVVRLGISSQISTAWLTTDAEWKWMRVINLPHPAALLRRGGIQAYDYGRYVETLRSIWRKE